MARKSQGPFENERNRRPPSRGRVVRARARRRLTPPVLPNQQPPSNPNQPPSLNQPPAPAPSPASSSASSLTNASSASQQPAGGTSPATTPTSTPTTPTPTPGPTPPTPPPPPTPPTPPPPAAAAAASGGPAPTVPVVATVAAVAAAAERQEPVSSDYQLLLTPLFAAMTKITDHLFLTGVGGMTRANFRKNHIDFVVNITTEAPFWDDIESMRVPLDDDVNANILPYLDVAVDRIHEAITRRNAHVLVHCVAGVSRSATIVIAYLMKIKRMDLRAAFNFCYNLRPVIRPNNGFMHQLINYEFQLFNKHSVHMTDVDVDGTIINVPSFFVDDYPKLILLEVLRVKEQQTRALREQRSKNSNKDRRSSHSADD